MGEVREKIEVRVGGTERQGDVEWTVLNQSLFGRARWRVRATREGVEQRFDDRTETLLRFPLEPGSRWTERLALSDGARQERVHEVREEKIEVPAGKFDCLRVDRTVDGKLESVSWYSRGVGLVKHVYLPGRKAEQVFSLFSCSAPPFGGRARPCRSGNGCEDALESVNLVCKMCGRSAEGTPGCVLCAECALKGRLCRICQGTLPPEGR
jgi:hypothetical protein